MSALPLYGKAHTAHALCVCSNRRRQPSWLLYPGRGEAAKGGTITTPAYTLQASHSEVSPAAVRPALMLTMIRETLAEARDKGIFADGVLPILDARVRVLMRYERHGS